MFYGLDVHKEFIQVCQLDAKAANRKDYRIGGSAEEIDGWARRLGPRDQVVLETTFHSWAIHSIVSQYAGRVVVANSLQVKAIAYAKIKTDKVDAYTLARLLHADFLPSVELPDEKTWALRQLVSHRRLLVKQRVAIKNTVLATFHRCLICPPEGDAFSARGRRWMRSLELAPAERFLVHNGLELLEAIEMRIDATDQELLNTAATPADDDPRRRRHRRLGSARRHRRHPALPLARAAGFLLRPGPAGQPVRGTLPPWKDHQGRPWKRPFPRHRSCPNARTEPIPHRDHLLSRSAQEGLQRRRHRACPQAHRAGLVHAPKR
jgi:transposase